MRAQYPKVQSSAKPFACVARPPGLGKLGKLGKLGNQFGPFDQRDAGRGVGSSNVRNQSRLCENAGSSTAFAILTSQIAIGAIFLTLVWIKDP